MEIDREIFDAVYKLLEAQGLTQQWKAQIRTEVINTIENEQKIAADAPTPKNYQRLRKMYKTPAARLAFDLIFELLDNLTLTYTESVLKAETDVEDGTAKSRRDLFDAFENLHDDDDDAPVLVQLVRKYMKDETSQSSQQDVQESSQTTQTYEGSETFVNSTQESVEDAKTPEKVLQEHQNETYVVTTPTIDQSESSEIQEDVQESLPSTEK
ncbi:uncharacterized protein LOC129796460 [Lutzomyia longipalpis]|uniref:uncharacterized protein LOC129796460 n=1 Tax=Lutzomyia longipalpis TaxID=7200 RepID=UPI00248382AB|nr:uncharacterized protein LOC129796460 [Lutzomyia longipalpis]